MKHRLFKLALFLILGAIVNIAVAWSIAWWGDPPTRIRLYESVTEEDRQWWIANRPLEGVGEPTVRTSARSIGVAEVELRVVQFQSDGRQVLRKFPNFRSIRRRIGVPLLTIEYTYWTQLDWPIVPVNSSIWNHTFPGRNIMPRHYHAQGVLAFDNKRPGCDPCARAIPYRVQPLGFVVNTIFYAVIVWILWSIPFTTRRMIRRKRGHCIKCGYDLRGAEHEVCPECGVAVNG